MILVDPRFGSAQEGHRSSHRAVAEFLSKLGFSIQHSQMECGDFAFLGNGPDGVLQVGIELKTVSDFVGSMRSGRLAEQVACMTQRYGRSYVIIEGPYRASRKNGLLEVPRGRGYRPLQQGAARPVYWADVQKYITGLEEAGVRVRHTRSSYETAQVIGNVLQSFWDKEYDAHRSLQVMHAPAAPMSIMREDKTVRRIRRVCQALDVGIGWERSKAVAQAFGSIEGIVSADVEAWEAIEGIGKTIAKEAYEAVRDQVPTVPRLSTRQLPQRVSAPARSARHSGKRPSHRLDPARPAQRRIPSLAASRGSTRRSRSE